MKVFVSCFAITRDPKPSLFLFFLPTQRNGLLCQPQCASPVPFGAIVCPPPLYLSCASGMECTNSCAFAHSTTRAPFTEVRRRMAHRPTVASWAPFCISYPVFAMLESMRDFLELVALRFFSHLGEEPLGNHFSILRKKTAQGL